MKKTILILLSMYLLVSLLSGCGQSGDTAEKTELVEEITEEIEEADYIIADDYKQDNGNTGTLNKVYQLGEWTYFSYFTDVNRINLQGTDRQEVYDAILGQHRGGGTYDFLQCGDYLVFTHGSYIYKMNLETLVTEVLLNADKKNTCFRLAVEGNDVYFTGYEGSYQGIYKININESEAEKIKSLKKWQRIWRLQVYDHQLYYSIPYEGIYRTKLDGSEKKRIIKGKHVSFDGFVIVDDYLYFNDFSYKLKRTDLKGKKMETLAKCFYYSVIDDYLIYSKVKREGSYHLGENLYRKSLLDNSSDAEQIYEGEVNILLGTSGNWIYFAQREVWDVIRIRLDGSGEMTLDVFGANT